MWSQFESYEEKARYILAHNKYMVVATSGEGGDPWAAPVFFAHDEAYNLYFLSAVDSRHVENIAKNPKVSLVIFDSAQSIGSSEEVQIEGKASLVEESEISKVIEIYCSKLFPKSEIPALERYNPQNYLGSAELRFFKVAVVKAYTPGPDRRVEVDMTKR